MSEVLRKNCEAVQTKDARLAQRLLSGEGAVTLEKAKNGELTFRYSGKYFHSSYDPLREAELQAGEIAAKKPDWVFLFGLGCGYLLKELLKRKKDKVIIYEPSDEILRGALSAIDLSDVLGLPTVYLCGSLERLVETVRNHTEGVDDILGYQPTPWRLAFPNELKDCINKVQNAHITNKVGILTELDSRILWLENYFSNTRSFAEHHPIDVFKGRFSGVPAVIVGAGPSLAKNAETLKAYKGKVLIIAAITAYKALLRHGVVPDIVMASEKVDLPEYFTNGPDDKKIRLALGEVSNPGMFERPVKGKFVYFNPYVSLSVKQSRLWGSEYLAASGGSVTTSAFDVALMMGCGPVIFIGQDLSYGEGGTHAQGGVYVLNNVEIDAAKGEVAIHEHYTSGHQRTTRHKLLWLKGIDGRPVASKFDWVTFHQWFENYLKHIRKNGDNTRVINATEGGAFIEGMEHITLREALNEFTASPARVEAILEDCEGAPRELDHPKLLESYGSMLTTLKVMESLARRVVTEAKRARNAFRKSGVCAEVRKRVEKLRGLEKRLFDVSDGAPFIWEAVVREVYSLKEHIKAEEESGFEARFEKDIQAIISSYGKVQDECARFLPKVEGAVNYLSTPAGTPADGRAAAGFD